jgi:hypothetical protein
MVSPLRPSQRDRPHCAHVWHPPFPQTARGIGSDPDRFLEDAFAGSAFSTDPLNAVMAWLFCVRSKGHVPAAALRLACRLRKREKPHSARQRQFLTLLDFIASHRSTALPRVSDQSQSGEGQQ